MPCITQLPMRGPERRTLHSKLSQFHTVHKLKTPYVSSNRFSSSCTVLDGANGTAEKKMNSYEAYTHLYTPTYAHNYTVYSMHNSCYTNKCIKLFDNLCMPYFTQLLHVSARLSRHLHTNCVKLQVISKHKPKTCFSNGEISLKYVRGFIFKDDLQVYTICVNMLVVERSISIIMHGTNIKFVWRS